ncbi:unnamed protein product, partial [marine sediment metagenome]
MGKYVFNPFTGNLDFLNDLTKIDSDLIPDTTNAYDVGSTTLKWKDGFFAGDLTVTDVYLTDYYITGKIIFDTGDY